MDCNHKSGVTFNGCVFCRIKELEAKLKFHATHSYQDALDRAEKFESQVKALEAKLIEPTYHEGHECCRKCVMALASEKLLRESADRKVEFLKAGMGSDKAELLEALAASESAHEKTRAELDASKDAIEHLDNQVKHFKNVAKNNSEDLAKAEATRILQVELLQEQISKRIAANERADKAEAALQSTAQEAEAYREALEKKNEYIRIAQDGIERGGANEHLTRATIACTDALMMELPSRSKYAERAQAQAEAIRLGIEYRDAEKALDAAPSTQWANAESRYMYARGQFHDALAKLASVESSIENPDTNPDKVSGEDGANG